MTGKEHFPQSFEHHPPRPITTHIPWTERTTQPFKQPIEFWLFQTRRRSGDGIASREIVETIIDHGAVASKNRTVRNGVKSWYVYYDWMWKTKLTILVWYNSRTFRKVETSGVFKILSRGWGLEGQKISFNKPGKNYCNNYYLNNIRFLSI